MDHRLHAKLKAALDPFAFEDYRKAKVKEKLEAKRTMRTKIRNKDKVEVNPSLHNQLQLAADEGDETGASKKRRETAEKAKRLLDDDRFKVLFADPDFAIQANGANASDSAAAAKSLLPKTKKRKG
ncbi:unnamed protein product [Polarella glacialis]|uniref:NUC153 domain-containing protein n=2 Tax=Polarella glacialis TaxID=89957 RepID=A0A813JC38_POLGL|nr:unnamed protein product [Polarella glacialis]